MSFNQKEHHEDPSRNVLNALSAAIDRLEALMISDIKRIDEKINDKAIRNLERFEAETKRVDELFRLRGEASLQLSIAETKRLDSVRSVDVAAVSVAAERSAQQAVVLASQVTASAETLRTLVASTATTVAQQLAQISSQLSDRISALEKSSYEGKNIGIPQEVTRRLAELEEQRYKGEGRGNGMEKMWSLVFVIGTFIIGTGLTLYLTLRK